MCAYMGVCILVGNSTCLCRADVELVVKASIMWFR